MTWIIVGVIAFYFGYKVIKQKAPLEDYVMKDLKEGDRIKIMFGYSESTFKVIKNYPEYKMIVIRSRWHGRYTKSYCDYNFNNHKLVGS